MESSLHTKHSLKQSISRFPTKSYESEVDTGVLLRWEPQVLHGTGEGRSAPPPPDFLPFSVWLLIHSAQWVQSTHGCNPTLRNRCALRSGYPRVLRRASGPSQLRSNFGRAKVHANPEKSRWGPAPGARRWEDSGSD